MMNFASYVAGFWSYRNHYMAWQKKYNAKAPKAGDMAPDFELRDVNGENPVRLSPLLFKEI